MVERGIARSQYRVFHDRNVIGIVTSGTYAPFLKKSIGMALVNSNEAKIDNEIEIGIRDKKVKAKIVKRPFYNYKGGN